MHLFPVFLQPFPDIDNLSNLVLRLSFIDLKQVKGTYEVKKFFKSVIPCIKLGAFFLDVLPDQAEFCLSLFIR